MTAGEAKRAMAALPLAGLDAILGGRDPLVLAPHPDDESLGCGGLLAACAGSGGRPAILVLTDGTGSHPNSRTHPPDRLAALRESEACAAAAALGVAADRVRFLGLRDTAAPTEGASFEAAVEAIVGALGAWRCGAVLAPWRHDPHGDHVAAHQMARQAASRTGALHLAYPVWGWTLPDDAPLDGPALAGWRLGIEAQRAAKRRAIAAHRSQHAGLIADDAAGFHLPASFLAHFDSSYETYLIV